MSLRRRCAIEQTVHELNLVEVGCRDDVLRALLSGPVTASTQTEEHQALLDPGDRYLLRPPRVRPLLAG